jgi:hypothetical protein
LAYNSIPSDEYISIGYQLIRRRIVIAGYRLAEIIGMIYQSYEKVRQGIEYEEALIKFLS